MTTEMATRETFADQLMDELMPDELDWRRMVTSYPVTSLTLAALGGYLLGRSRGPAILGALAGFASDTVSKNVNHLLGEDVL